MAICWIAHIRPRPGATDVLRLVLQSMVAPTRLEVGCAAYNLHELNTAAQIEFLFYEIWVSEADHSAHMRTAHVQAFLTRLICRGGCKEIIRAPSRT